MNIAKQAEIEQELKNKLKEISDLTAPDGYVYKHRYLSFVSDDKYITFKTYYYLLGRPLTRERIKEIFGADQEPPYIETEADYELIEETENVM